MPADVDVALRSQAIFVEPTQEKAESVSILGTVAQMAYRRVAPRHEARRPVLAGLGPLPDFVLGGGTLHALYARRNLLRPCARAFELLDAALGAGCHAIDIAPVYGNGTTERIVGRYLKSRAVRDRVILIGKGGHPHAPGVSRLDAAALTADLEGSLQRLGVDYLDLYLLHRDDTTLPVGSIMTALHRLVQAGKVRALGVSNWTHERIEQANAYVQSQGLTPLVASSPQFGLAGFETPPWPGCVSIGGTSGTAARAWYAATQMPVLAWSPLSAGYLAGKPDLDDAQTRAYDSEQNRGRRDRMAQMARERGVPEVRIGLAYVRSVGIKVHPVVYTQQPERLRALLAAGGASEVLTAADVEWLETGSRVATIS